MESVFLWVWNPQTRVDIDTGVKWNGYSWSCLIRMHSRAAPMNRSVFLTYFNHFTSFSLYIMLKIDVDGDFYNTFIYLQQYVTLNLVLCGAYIVTRHILCYTRDSACVYTPTLYNKIYEHFTIQFTFKKHK